MTYARVVPRDLFNEGDLLNCLGRLWIKLDERRDHRARLDWAYEGDDLRGFDVRQDSADGSICSTSVRLHIWHPHERAERWEPVHLFRPLNARDKWPLYARIGDDDVRVFDLDGELSPEFWIAITEGPGA